ncbi:MAG: DNA polymerase ligase N-terminal domain-containing protein, partial [Patescibacteria group bacterium]|nr:DNA polymerase ligase N-terminal domain-containing protein [Patescibacteria group bacterium]
MSLKKYQTKRKKEKTPEPFGTVKNGEEVFVVQEHHATNLHWDFRLARKENNEWVLKSWAVPKEPPIESKIKRLAVQVEDHPYNYKNFEGKIPEGEYGAGTVKIWDKGKYKVKEWNDELIEVELFGQKLKGWYVLVKPKGNF